MKRDNLLLGLASASLLLLAACGGGGGGGGSEPVDTDGDGVADTTDNCPNVVNATQADADSDGIGDACDTPAEPDFVSCAGDVCTLSGTVDEDYTLDAAREWQLDGDVIVGAGNVVVADAGDVADIKAAGVTLTIEPGVEVKALNGSSLLVTRGSKLIAEGTASSPIRFSSIDADSDGEGEWGGVILQGFAPQYGKGDTGACFGSGTVCNVVGEGGAFIGVYGGNDPADDSGVLKYVTIAEGGKVASANNEINGLTLQGVGYGTTIDYVQIHSNLDDGIEWFGGTVNATHVVLTSNDDDDLDYDEGYMGNIQYVIVKKNPTKAAPTGTNDPRMIEANSSDPDFVSQTDAVIANFTGIGSTVSSGQPGWRLRGAVKTAIYNSALNQTANYCIRIDDAKGNTLDTPITLVNILGECTALYEKELPEAEVNVSKSSVTLDDAYAVVEGSAQLSSAPAITAVNNGSSFMFEQTDYIGAVEPGTSASNAWWAGWTIPGTLGEITETVDDSPAFVTCNTAKTTCTLTGSIDEDYTLVSSATWELDGDVIVGAGNVNAANDAEVAAIKAAGVTLTIRPGTDVHALSGSSLLVTRGSKLIANGSRTAPITFSSSDDGYEGEGEWGGVILQGFAPQYGKGNTGPCFGSGTVCNVVGEGGAFVGVYGGSDKSDSSGILRYVRIAEGGKVASANNEINGLTLQGVGYGTTIDYVQIHSNLDDGIEWFGGTVNATHVVLTSNDDDDLDYDEGYMGNIQYVIVKKNPTKAAPTGSNDPRMIEANSSDPDFVSATDAVISNFTGIGSMVSSGQPGWRLRGAVNTVIYNSAVSANAECAQIDDANGNTIDTPIVLVNILGQCTDLFKHQLPESQTNVTKGTVTLDSALAVDAPAVTAPTIDAVDNGSGFTFDSTDFIGAVKPGTVAADAWWADWTLPGTL
jgi:hypothetical protein